MDTSIQGTSAPKVETEDFSSLPISSLITAIRVGVNLDQLDLMLTFMEANFEHFKSPTRRAKKMSTELWDTLSGNLNALRPLKSKAEWQKVWANLKVVAKSRLDAHVKLSKETDNPLIGYYDEKVLNAIGIKLPKAKVLGKTVASSAIIARDPLLENRNSLTKTDPGIKKLISIAEEVHSQIKDTLISVKHGFDQIVTIALSSTVTEDIDKSLALGMCTSTLERVQASPQ